MGSAADPDPVLFLPSIPVSVEKNRNLDPISGINIPDHISKSLAKQFLAGI
jgi:hypothetical protein